jgi:hypothetical protein
MLFGSAAGMSLAYTVMNLTVWNHSYAARDTYILWLVLCVWGTWVYGLAPTLFKRRSK